jgi:predicted methyltransferase
MTSDKRDDRRSSIFEDDHDRMKLIFNVEKYYAENDPEDIPDLVKDKKYIVFPAKYIVCYVCEGRGSYVNPNVDQYGLDPSDMDEDFAESYWEGAFDVTCQYCNGKRVVLVIDRMLSCHKNPDIDQQLLEFITKEQEEQAIEEQEHRALVRSEQLAGC